MKTILTFIISAFLISACSQGNAQENMTVGELNAIDLKSDNSKIVLDVRTAQEYAEGKISGSTNLDVLKN